HRKHLGGARPPQIIGEIGLRLDEDAGPTELLQGPGLRLLLRAVGADLDEEARPRAAKKLPHELPLPSIGQGRNHSFRRAASRAPDSSGRARLADNLGRAEAGHEIDEDHLAAFAFDELAPHYLLAPVVAALDQDFGMHAADQLERRILAEDDDEVDGLE